MEGSRIPCIPFHKLPEFPQIMLRNHVDNPDDYEFVEYGWEYDEQTVVIHGNLVPHERMSKIIYRHKHTGDKYIIDLSTEKER